MQFDVYMKEFSYIDEIRSEKMLFNREDLIAFLESPSDSDNKKGGHLDKIINTLRSILRNIYETISRILRSIQDKLSYAFLSSEKKKQFDEFSEWVAQNPQVKGKQLRVKDWKRIINEYDTIERKIVSMMKDDKVDAKGMSLQAYDLLENMDSVAKGAVNVLTVDAAMYFAKKSPDIAKQVQDHLRKNQALIQNMQDQLGNKEAIKFQKKLDKLTKETTYQKIMTKFFNKKQQTLSEVLDEYVSSFSKIKTTGGKLSAAKSHMSGVVTSAKVYAKDKKVRKGVKQASDVVNNSQIRDGIGVIKEFIKPKV